MIELRRVSKTFNQSVKAVDNVSITINEGEIYGIIGFSGAGKSTLVRLMNLLETPDQGEVYIDKVELTQLSKKKLREERKNIGMIFQQFNLFNSRTVYDNVAFTLPKNHDKDKVMDLLKLVEIEDKKDAYPSELSGGQKQRVAIARALANDPKVLLCDEATSALDPQTTQSILQLLKDVNEKLGITIVIITHEMSVIKDICDRVAIMESGKIIEENTVENLFSKPQSKIAQEFTSNMKNIETILENNQQILNINEADKVLKIDFIGEEIGVPLISNLTQEFNIEASIVYGTVDIIKQTPLGSLIVILKGDPITQQKAIDYIKQVAKVEVI
ncbi:MAG: ATP-binding cassette domain-containing protein [Erysipelothrix sp.]|nr:ATP-binding cassette domain-containing protein [Erysipelothrix sp.]